MNFLAENGYWLAIVVFVIFIIWVNWGDRIKDFFRSNSNNKDYYSSEPGPTREEESIGAESSGPNNNGPGKEKKAARLKNPRNMIYFLLFGILFFSAIYLQKDPKNIYAIVGFIAPIAYWLIGIRKILPDQWGVRVFWGKPETTKKQNQATRQENKVAVVKESGFCHIFPFLEELVRYTKEVMTFKFKVTSIITKRGKIKNYLEHIEPADIDLTCTIYARFDKDNLLQTIEKAPGTSASELGPYLVPYTMDTVRAFSGRLPWRLINQARHLFANIILSRLSPIADCPPKILPAEEDEKVDSVYSIDTTRCEDKPITAEQLKSSPFVQFGLTEVAFTIENLDFTDEDLKQAISAPERERLNADGVRRKAEGERYKREHEGHGDAIARKAMIDVIKEEKDLEVIKTLREMAQGTSNTIFYQLPESVQNRLSSILENNGNGQTAELLKTVLSNPEVLRFLKDAVEKTKRT